MKKFIPREKLGKKARKRLDGEHRATWAFSPATKRVESKKLYDRKRRSHDRYDDAGMGSFLRPFGSDTVLRGKDPSLRSG